MQVNFYNSNSGLGLIRVPTKGPRDLITDSRGVSPTPELDRTELPGSRVALTFAVIYPDPRQPPRTAPVPPTIFHSRDTASQRDDETCDSFRMNAQQFPSAMATPPPRKRVSQACRPCGVKKIKVRDPGLPWLRTN